MQIGVTDGASLQVHGAARKPLRVVLIDLNNFSRFPTLPVGLLCAVLRAAGHQVRVLSPFATGMPGIPRGARAGLFGLWDERLRWWSATTNSRLVRGARRKLEARRRPDAGGRSAELERTFETVLDERPDCVLVSTYLMYYELVTRLGRACQARGVPMIVGGPAFHTPETRKAWDGVPGSWGIYAGEGERHVQALLFAVASGERAPRVPGFTPSGGPDGGLADPLTELNMLPYPDYDDFPWDRYPNRIASILSARGCGWGVCKFCSDVVTVNGRGFRSRSLENVLGELAHLHQRYQVKLFCFSDLKLNSDLAVWRGLCAQFQSAVPGAQWTCSVHVGPRPDEGLSEADLVAARKAGLVRITTGLESGSQRLLDAMAKGSRVASYSAFYRAAKRAGISTRATAFSGYPGERAEDLDQTAAFLDEHADCIDRVHFSRFLIQSGTGIERALAGGSSSSLGLENLQRLPGAASVLHTSRAAQNWSYRLAASRLLAAVHRINRRHLDPIAREFEGAM